MAMKKKKKRREKRLGFVLLCYCHCFQPLSVKKKKITGMVPQGTTLDDL